MAHTIMNSPCLPFSPIQYIIRKNCRLFGIFPDIFKFSARELLYLQLGLLRFVRAKDIISDCWNTELCLAKRGSELCKSVLAQPVIVAGF